MEQALWRSVRCLLAERHVNEAEDGAPPAGVTEALDFGAYSDLVLDLPHGRAIGDGDRASALARLRSRFAGERAAKRDTAAEGRAVRLPIITNLSPEWYSADELDRLRRWWDIEPDNAMALTASSEQELAAAREWVPYALTRLRECAPELHGEVVGIVREIVIARPDGSQLLEYGAASSFALWGAVAVNAAAHDSWPRYYRTIVHEAAHLLLFGLAREEPLVQGGPDHAYASPLREDLRPLDGLFHAAFVSARESLAIDRLLARQEATAFLSSDDEEQLLDLLESSVVAFWDCADRVRASGKLTALGDAILSECEGYMRSNFALRG